MSPGVAGLVTFLAIFVVLEVGVWLVTHRDIEGMPPGAHKWNAAIAALAAVLVAIQLASV